ncbi:monocarboxylate transporter 14 [Elysia marginata]|uniref:Monocarboxylate transporter 14 n=1 Tax=Elysia marginata TaxID=1093978 RepID=A0AAV4EB85_9GAST|nr:monocarboxylate transporter 14 [Elysia marginata]
MRSDGVFYLQFQERFNQSKQLTAWPSSISFTLQCFIAPVATAFCNRYSVRTSVHLGTFLLVTGMVITAFAPNIYLLFLSYSVLQGIGRGLILAPGIFIVNMYFNKWMGVALGLASAGTGVGTLAFPPLFEWLFDTFHYKDAFLIIGGIATFGWIIGMLLRPLSMHKEVIQERLLRDELSRKGKSFSSWYGSIGSPQGDQSPIGGYGKTSEQDNKNPTDLTLISPESEMLGNKPNPKEVYQVIAEIDMLRQQRRKENCFRACLGTIFPVEGEKRGKRRRRLFDWSLFKDFPFLVMCVSMAFFNIAQKTVFTFLPAYCEQQGVPEYGVVVSVAGAGDTLGRIAAGLLMDRPFVRPFRGAAYSLVLFIAGGAALVIPFSKSLLLLCVASSIYGSMVGASVSQKSTVLAALLGKETVNSAFGILYAFQGLGTLTGPPLSGALRDKFGDYKFAFYLSGGSMFNAGLLVAISVLLFALRRLRYEKRGSHQFDTQPTSSSEKSPVIFNNNPLHTSSNEALSGALDESAPLIKQDEIAGLEDSRVQTSPFAERRYVHEQSIDSLIKAQRIA